MKRRSSRGLRVPTLILCALFAIQSHPSRAATAGKPPPPAPPSTSTPVSPPPASGGLKGTPKPSSDDGESRSSGTNLAPWIIGVGAVTALAIAMHAQKNKAKASDTSLLESGPRFPDSYAVGVFAVQGYVADGWPVVVDFVPQPGTCTTLEISVDQNLQYGEIIDWDGRAGRQYLRTSLPPPKRRKGAILPARSEARAGLYVIHSRTPACAEDGPQKPAPIEVYGIGAGPRAVGSVAIDNLSFGPAHPRFPKEQAAIGYEARNPFNHATVEILRYDVSTPGVINVQRIRTSRTDAVQVGPNSGAAWNGMNDTGARSTGVHRLQVRGWYTENDRSWVGAISPTSVQVAP